MVTILALGLQALKLGSRRLLIGEWPTGGQWGQLCIVAWLLFSVWEGKNWARVTAAVYFTVAAVAGGAIVLLMWSKAGVGLRAVSLVIVAGAGAASAVLWFSGALRHYMAERLAAGGDDE